MIWLDFSSAAVVKFVTGAAGATKSSKTPKGAEIVPATEKVLAGLSFENANENGSDTTDLDVFVKAIICLIPSNNQNPLHPHHSHTNQSVHSTSSSASSTVLSLETILNQINAKGKSSNAVKSKQSKQHKSAATPSVDGTASSDCQNDGYPRNITSSRSNSKTSSSSGFCSEADIAKIFKSSVVDQLPALWQIFLIGTLAGVYSLDQLNKNLCSLIFRLFSLFLLRSRQKTPECDDEPAASRYSSCTRTAAGLPVKRGAPAHRASQLEIVRVLRLLIEFRPVSICNQSFIKHLFPIASQPPKTLQDVELKSEVSSRRNHE